MSAFFKIETLNDDGVFNQIGLAKGYAQLSAQLGAKSVPNTTVINLTKQVAQAKKNNTISFNRGEYRITRIITENKREFNNPLNKTIEKVKTIKKTGKSVIEINKSRTEDFRKFLTESRRDGLQAFIQKRLVKVSKTNNAFAIIIKLRAQGISKEVQTAFTSYNNLLGNLETLINQINEQYDDEIEFVGLKIEYFKRDNLPESFIFGCKENELMLKELMGDLYINIERQKLTTFLKKWCIVSPSTYSLCVIKACIIAMRGDDKEKTKITEEADRYPKRYGFSDDMNLSEKLTLISNKIKRNINVYTPDELEKELSIKTEGSMESINILIYASHSFALINRKEHFNEVAFYQNYSKQYKMEKPKAIENTDIIDNEEPEIIKGKKSNIFWGSYDFETYNSEDDVKPYAVGWTHNIQGSYKDNYEFIYDDKNTTLQFIEKLKTLNVNQKENNKLLLYAHNGGKFDAYEIIYKLITKTDIPIFNSLIKDGRIFQFSIKLKNKLTIEFRDSYIMCAGRLEDLLKEFNCETKKLVGDIDHKTVRDVNFMKIKQKALPYLQNDVLGLYELIEKMNVVYKDDYNINLANTLTCASASRHFFIDNHCWDNFPLYDIPFNQYLEIKPFYYGGRCECFHIGAVDKPLFYYDFTSLYPYVMAKSLYPYGKYVDKKVSKYNPDWFGLVQCTVRTTDYKMKPYLAHKSKDGKLLFSHFKTPTELWITTEEYRYIMENKLGYDIQPNRVLDYGCQKAKYFSGMIDSLFKAKKQADIDGNKARRAMAKTIVNSLYGFFGIKLSDNVKVHIKQFTSPEKKSAELNKHLCRNRLLEFQDVGTKTIIKTNEQLNASCANLIIAIFTTAYARTELYELMTDVEKNNGYTYYCDTDSIITDIDFSKNIELSKKYNLCVKGLNLGDLTNEAGSITGGYQLGVFLACKSYLLVRDSYDESKYREPITYSELSKLGKQVIRKFKGINVKNIFRNKEIDTNKTKKTITFSGEENFEYENKKISLLDPTQGYSTLWIQDYRMMADKYKVITDNWCFLTGSSSLSQQEYIKFQSNTKCSQSNNYSKGQTQENGRVIPLII